MDEEADPQHCEKDEPQCELDDGAPVLEQLFRRKAPAVEKQQRRQQEQEEDLRIERDDKLTGQADHRANSDLDQGARIANGDMRARTSLSTTARKNRVTATLSIVCAGRLRRGNGHHRVRPQRFEGRGDHAGRSSRFESTTTR